MHGSGRAESQCCSPGDSIDSNTTLSCWPPTFFADWHCLAACLPAAADVDVIVLQNPFDFLVRDSDIEGMSDGWDNGTAYGELVRELGVRPASSSHAYWARSKV